MVCKVRTVAFVIAITLAMPIAAKAAEISVTPGKGGNDPIISIDGDIEKGDDGKFRAIAAEHSSAIVLLNSDGGAIAPAMDIGRTIKLREYSTAVYKYGICASACALIWVAGTRRVIFEGGKVGFHASYLDVDGSKIETGMGNALVGHYLSQLGFGEKAVVFATAAPPEKILWLDSETASFAGIEYKVIPIEGEPQKRRSAANAPARSTLTYPLAPTADVRPQSNVPAATQSDKHGSYQQWMADAKNTVRSPEAIAQALRQQGYQAILSYENADMPMLTTGVGGEQIAVSFSGCTKDGCNYIQFLDWITDVTRREADWLTLESARNETYSHVLWIEKKSNIAFYNYIVIGTDGITIQTLVENMNYFVDENRKLSQKILDFRKSN